MREVKTFFPNNLIENFTQEPITSKTFPHLAGLSPVRSKVREIVRSWLRGKGYNTYFLLDLVPDSENKNKFYAIVKFTSTSMDYYTEVETINYLRRSARRKVWEFTYEEIGFGFLTEFPDDFMGYNFRDIKGRGYTAFVFARRFYQLNRHESKKARNIDDIPCDVWYRVDADIVLPLFLGSGYTIDGWVYKNCPGG